MHRNAQMMRTSACTYVFGHSDIKINLEKERQQQLAGVYLDYPFDFCVFDFRPFPLPLRVQVKQITSQFIKQQPSCWWVIVFLQDSLHKLPGFALPFCILFATLFTFVQCKNCSTLRCHSCCLCIWTGVNGETRGRWECGAGGMWRWWYVVKTIPTQTV